MKITAEKVLERLLMFTGDTAGELDERRTALCQELCAGCAQEAMALPWIEPEGEVQEAAMQSAAEGLAAAGAFYQLALLDRANEPLAVSSPELKVTLGNRAAEARSLRDELLKGCEGLMSGHGFYFGAV